MINLGALDDRPCKRDNAGCATHQAVWEQRFSTCWYRRRVGKFADPEYLKCHDARMVKEGA